MSLLCLFFNVTSKIFHTITFLSFWASNHDVNCCHANWALLVQHQMPAEWNQRPATKPLHLRESTKELSKSNSVLSTVTSTEFRHTAGHSLKGNSPVSPALLLVKSMERRFSKLAGVSASMEHDFPGSQSLISLDV